MARMEEGRVVHKVLVGNLRERDLWGDRRRCEDNIKMDLQEVGKGCGDWICNECVAGSVTPDERICGRTREKGIELTVTVVDFNLMAEIVATTRMGNRGTGIDSSAWTKETSLLQSV